MEEIAKDYLPSKTIVLRAARREQTPDEKERFARWFQQSSVVAATRMVDEAEALQNRIDRATKSEHENGNEITWTRTKKRLLGEQGQKLVDEFIRVERKFKLFEQITLMIAKTANPEIAASLAYRFSQAAKSITTKREFLLAYSGATGGMLSAGVAAHRIVTQARMLYERTSALIPTEPQASKSASVSPQDQKL